MKNMFLTLRSPALISLFLIIPFMIMEVVNRREFNEGFPFPLFIIMWLLPVLFILTGMPILRNMRGDNVLARPALLLIRVVILILIAWFWAALLIDQMPCFLGVPNCD